MCTMYRPQCSVYSNKNKKSLNVHGNGEIDLYLREQAFNTDHEITQINELAYMTLKQLICSVTRIKERIIIISEQEKHLRMNGNCF